MNAPGASPSPPLSPTEIMATPKKLTPIPIQPRARSRSPRNAVAKSAVKIGAVAISKLAPPAVTVNSPYESPV